MNTIAPANGKIERGSMSPEGEFLSRKGDIFVYSIDQNTTQTNDTSRAIVTSDEISAEITVGDLEQKILALKANTSETSKTQPQAAEQVAVVPQTAITKFDSIQPTVNEPMTVTPKTPVHPGIVSWFKNRVLGNTDAAGGNRLLEEKKTKGLALANSK